MTIKRVLDGKEYEIELTDQEMLDVYNAVDQDRVIGRLKERLEFWSEGK